VENLDLAAVHPDRQRESELPLRPFEQLDRAGVEIQDSCGFFDLLLLDFE
jgi:hypothetical protein